MQPHLIGLTALATLLATFSGDGGLATIRQKKGQVLDGQLIQNYPILAQTADTRKAEAEQLFGQGKKQLDTSQFQAALQSFLQALNIYRAINDRTSEAETLNKLGEVYRNLGETQTALKHHEQALVMMRELNKRAGEAESLHNIASVYETQGKYEDALKFYDRALPIRREVKDKAGEAATLIGLGNTYLSYIEFKQLYRLIKKPEEVKPYQEILKYYEQALAIAREIGYRTGEAWSLNGIGMTYNALRKKEDALKFREQALAIMREVGNRAGEATILFHTGSAYWSERDPKREYRPISLDFYEQALAIVREIGHRPLEAQILYMMGLSYSNKWHIEWNQEDEKGLETVLDFYKQALAIVRQVGHRPLEERVLNSIASTHGSLGYPQNAQEYQEQALAIRQEIGIHLDFHLFYIVKEAILVTYNTPKKRPTLITFLKGEAINHYRNGEAHAHFGRYQAALESYQQALAIIRRQGNRPWEWVILNQMGKVYGKIGQLQVALDTYKQSLAIRREVDERAAREPIPHTIRVAYGTNVNVGESEGIRLEEGITNNLIRVGEGEPITTPITTVEDTNTIRERGSRRLEVVAGESGWKGYVNNEEEDTLTNIGDIYKALGQDRAALKSYEEALAILRQEMESEESKEAPWERERVPEGNYRQQEQRILRSMGSVYEALGQDRAALESYEQSLAIAKKGSSFGTSPWYQIPILLTQIGKVYEQLGQDRAAIEPYQQALAIARERRGYYRSQEQIIRKYGQEQYFRRYRMVYEKPDEEALLNSIATIYEKLGQNQAAQEYRQQALAFRQEISNRIQENVTPGKAILLTEMETDETKKTIIRVNRLEGEAVILFAAGNTYSVQEEYQAALKSFQQALAIVRQQGNRPWEGVILNQIGSVYKKLGQNQAALQSYQQALILGQEIDRRFEEKATLINFSVGSTHYVLEFRFDSGQVITFNKAGGLIVEAQKREDTLIEIGNIYKALGQNQAALESYQQALAFVRNDELKRREKEGIILERIGSVYDNLQYEAALKAYQQLLTTGLNYDEKRSVLNSIGTVYRNMGQYQAALDSYNQALAIIRDKQRYHSDAANGEGTILNNIGTVYEQLGQYSTALESYQKALAIVTESSWRQTTLINIGSVSAKMGEHQAALESYDRALAIARGVNDRPTEGITLLHKGKVYQKIGQHQTALESYQQALTILRQVGNRPGEGSALNNLGEAYYHLKEYQTALEHYQQALAVREEVGDKTGKGVTFNNIGTTLEAQNQPELAIVFYKQSVNITEAIRKDIQGLSKEQQRSYTETVASTYRNLADLLLKQNRVLEAQQVLDLLKVQELEDYLRNVRGNEQTVQGVPNTPPEQQIKQGYEQILDKAIQTGKELAKLENIPSTNRTPAQQKRLLELRKTEQEITKQFTEFLKSPAVNSAVGQLRQVTGGESLALKDFNSLRDNLQRLQQNAVVLYPLILDDRLELILVTPYSPPIRRTVAVKREQLNQAIIEARRALTDVNSDPTIPSRQLYEWLIKPIENDLAKADAKTIIYAPDGQLRYIPIAALYDGKQWLIQRFRINNITAASLTDFNTKPQEKLQILAGAFTKGSYTFKVGEQDFTLSGLPFAGREVENLAAIVPGTTKRLNNEFNRELILSMNDYSVVHLATHAEFVTGQPENSFILFGNGDRVTLRDIETWSLPKVDLVVLSACQTAVGGMGNGQEILGFGYQIQRTGARAAIASLWSVDDGGTQALMNAFYTVLSKGNITKAEALRQAQIALITDNYATIGQQRGIVTGKPINSSISRQVSDRLSHPFYWAPFILIGNGL